MNREASKHKILRRGEEGREGDILSEREVKRLGRKGAGRRQEEREYKERR